MPHIPIHWHYHLNHPVGVVFLRSIEPVAVAMKPTNAAVKMTVRFH
jgi:hypothetical protein